MKTFRAALLAGLFLFALGCGHARGEMPDDAQGMYRVIWSDGEKNEAVFGVAKNLYGEWTLTDDKGVSRFRLHTMWKSDVIKYLGKPAADASLCLGALGASVNMFCVTRPGVPARFAAHDFWSQSADFVSKNNHLFFMEMTGIFDLEKVADAVPSPPLDDAELLKKAEAGDDAAQYEAGLYYFGQIRAGNTQSAPAKLAAEWTGRSAAQGNRDALARLGSHYLDGVGVERNPELALKYYEMAAAKGDTYAMGCLAGMFLNGRGVPRDEKKGAQWWLKAAEQGDATARYRLIDLYSAGKGVPRDGAKALEWAGTCIKEHGDSRMGRLAMQRMAEMYAEGDALPRNPKKAVYWMRKAALAGMPKAMAALAGYYRNGLGGMPPDPVLALAWLRQAKDEGADQDTLDQLEALEAGLTEAQRQAAGEAYDRITEARRKDEREPEPE